MSRPATVLVVDDEELIVAILKHKLAARGYRVVSAADGAAGIARARSEKPDLIVLDMMMPVLGGRQVLQDLRADPALAGIPVIMLTARRGEGEVVDALALGADDYVLKPFSPEELVARVSRLLPKNPPVRP